MRTAYYKKSVSMLFQSKIFSHRNLKRFISIDILTALTPKLTQKNGGSLKLITFRLFQVIQSSNEARKKVMA